LKTRKYIKDNILKTFQQQGKGDRPFRILGKWQDNYQANELAGVFKSMRSVEVLRHYAIDTPILLVAASPHLDDTIDQVHEYRDQVYIICCDVAINCLVKHGITPDMVVALDTSPVIALHFHGIDTSDVKLVCPTTIHPNVLKVWMGPVFFFNQRDYLQHKDKFLTGLQRNTKYPVLVNKDYVGACSYQVARYMSDQPILLMGYGFAYKDARRYCSGVYEARRQEEIPVTPEKALTSTTLIMFCRILEEMIRGDDQVINCTGGGILQKNNVMTLQEAGERYGIWS
jgi:hypothetical protein